MKKSILYALLFFTLNILSQERLMTAKGNINFEASVPFFEEVKAKNEDVICILNHKNGELSCTVLIKKFQFKRDLMYEHFNDNYLESDRYSKATFKGIIDKFDLKDINNTNKEYLIKGKIEIHGKSKKISVTAKIKKIDNEVQIVSNFTLNTEDFNIEIPSMVIAKISKFVNTEIDFKLK